MFDDSLFKIIGHSCIKHCLLIIGKNVNIVLSIIVEHNPFRIDASFLGMTIIKNVTLYSNEQAIYTLQTHISTHLLFHQALFYFLPPQLQ